MQQTKGAPPSPSVDYLSSSLASRMARLGIGGLLILIGVVLIGGGAWLVWLGGSPYYVLAGLACLVSGIAIMQGAALGIVVYAVFVAATALWAIGEVGLHFWLLLPRVTGPVVIAALLALPAVRRRISPAASRATIWAAPAATLLGIVLLIGSYAMGAPSLTDHHIADDTPSWTVAKNMPDDWTDFGRTAAGTRYSPDTQITPANIATLQRAWVYETGESAAKMPQVKAMFSFMATPLEVDGTVYFCTPLGNVVALDGDTGKQRWRFDAQVQLGDTPMLNCRGVSYHRDPAAGSGPCIERILSTTTDGRLIALDAATGLRCAGFGQNGEVSLHEGLGPITPAASYTSSPPTIIGDAAVLGAYVRDNAGIGEPSGVVRAFDVHTGQLLWAWDAGRPDDAGALKPGETYTRGSANAWTVFSADPVLGLVYVPTGNATPDHVGMHRSAQDEKYSSSLVALDAKTGKVVWHFQTTHHDLWDYDMPSQAVLFNYAAGGGSVPAIAAPTKRGEIFVFDRRNGTPLTGVTERAAPGGDIPGERYSPTQPYSTGFPSFAPKPLTEADMWGATPLDQLWCRIRFHSLDYKGNMTPPSVRGTLQYPGIFGQLNWGSVSIDEGRQVMFANMSAIPTVVHLVPRSIADQTYATGSKDMHSGYLAQKGTGYGLTLLPMLSPLGIPCPAPPWGSLAAIDLRTKSVLWQRPLGTSGDLAPFGIPVPGIFNIGGSVVTKSGLLFIGATLDNYLRAFDTSNGREIWHDRLPASAQAGAMTFISPKTQKQYVVIAAGGHGFLRSAPGDYVIAYRLP